MRKAEEILKDEPPMMDAGEKASVVVATTRKVDRMRDADGNLMVTV
jgi:hypothetical protein